MGALQFVPGTHTRGFSGQIFSIHWGSAGASGLCREKVQGIVTEKMS